MGLASFGEWSLLDREDQVHLGFVGLDHWNPPSHGFLKLYVDAAVIGGSKHVGIGAVGRNSNGEVIGAVSSALTGGFTPFAAECLALREGLQFAKSLGVDSLDVESDAYNVVLAVLNGLEFAAESPVDDDIRLLLSDFSKANVVHIRWTANGVAHILSQFGYNSCKLHSWMNETPFLVSTAVSLDYNAQ